MLSLPDHPIFESFKDRVFNFDLTVCWPAGAGGHFLINLIDKKLNYAKINWSDSNEFTQMYSVNNLVDSLYTDHILNPRENAVATDKTLDDLYDMVISKTMDTLYNRNNGMTRILTGHYLPLLLGNIYNYHTDEIVIVDVKPEHRWMIKLIGNYKLYMHSSFNASSVIDTINDFNWYYGDAKAVIDLNDFHNIMRNLDWGTDMELDWWTNPTPMRYYVWLKKNGFNHSDSRMKTFIKKEFFTPIMMQDYPANIDHLTNWCDRITHLDYVDVFFKRLLPENGYLSGVDLDDLRLYSDKNLDIIRKLIMMLHPDDQAFYIDQIESFTA